MDGLSIPNNNSQKEERPELLFCCWVGSCSALPFHSAGWLCKGFSMFFNPAASSGFLATNNDYSLLHYCYINKCSTRNGAWIEGHSKRERIAAAERCTQCSSGILFLVFHCWFLFWRLTQQWRKWRYFPIQRNNYIVIIIAVVEQWLYIKWGANEALQH